jgi:choline dehydrogenase-like flavoprotein
MIEYTHIVIGAGSSGCVVASRLSEEPDYRVLLIEAGPDYLDGKNLPEPLINGFFPDLTSHDWEWPLMELEIILSLLHEVKLWEDLRQ